LDVHLSQISQRVFEQEGVYHVAFHEFLAYHNAIS
jgi:hypothetical protein